MSPQRLALRTLMLGRTRSVLAIVLIGASLCVLDLFAGHIASVRAGIEHQAVFGERLGHLAIVRSASKDDTRAPMFDAVEADRVRRLVEGSTAVALVMPQMSVSGIASSGQRSALFRGQGIVDTPAGVAATLDLPGKLKPSSRNGIAVSSGQAQSLGLRQGSNLTLTGASLNTAPVPVSAEVVDVYSSANSTETGPTVLMPLALAQTLQGTARTERFVVFLAEGFQIEEQRTALANAVRGDGIAVDVRTWQEQSGAYAKERNASDLAFDSVAGMVFAVIAATIAATISMNAFERRREVGTLRALGMRSHSVFLMFVSEALGMALIGVAASLIGSGLIAWVVNRAALSYSTGHTLGRAPMLVELDFNRMLMGVVTVLAVALLAALVPSFKAARAGIAPALAA